MTKVSFSFLEHDCISNDAVLALEELDDFLFNIDYVLVLEGEQAVGLVNNPREI